MTAASVAERRALQARAASGLTQHLENQAERLGWDADRLADYQRERLRVLLIGWPITSASACACCSATPRSAPRSTPGGC